MNPASCAASLGMFMTTLPGALKHAIDRLHCGHRAIGFLPTVVAIAHVGVILQRVTRVDQSGDEFFVGREAHDRPSALAMAAIARSNAAMSSRDLARSGPRIAVTSRNAFSRSGAAAMRRALACELSRWESAYARPITSPCAN